MCHIIHTTTAAMGMMGTIQSNSIIVVVLWLGMSLYSIYWQYTAYWLGCRILQFDVLIVG